MRRLFDVVCSAIGLMVLLPVIVVFGFIIWLQDRHSPFYVATRMGRDEHPFRMYKLRSMIIRADANKVDSTANNDPRITGVGRLIRRLKLDEIPQLWNVLIGDMSLVGPRPNVARETDLYTAEEKKLLSVRPGITDISSIVFSDEGTILEGCEDADLTYNQIIRPYKSRLGLLYVSKASLALNFKLIILTLWGAVDRSGTLKRLSNIVRSLGDPKLAQLTLRTEPLIPAPPPGATEIVQHRGGS